MRNDWKEKYLAVVATASLGLAGYILATAENDIPLAIVIALSVTLAGLFHLSRKRK